ncbi:hypothetical protein Q8F55_006054 [Vanrija albida]|uniref:Major facilitator superfamily (MFS) profile domain-containing protein n=1 Tax=Vanrija albida TaxID=181172 RepID=A0ABR3Q3J6_9TREE
MDAPAAISRYNVARRYSKRGLLIAINCMAGLSIFFFGYDQGMMGGVNTSEDYIKRMGFGYTHMVDGHPTPVVTDSLLQGGIVSVYYLGCLVGCLVGGLVGERYGRIKTIALGAFVAIVGASLQCSAMNSDWMIVARLVNGWGTGILNAIVPVWATETSDHTSRGQFIAIEFTLNIFGVVVAYWMAYGLFYIDGGRSPFRWRFPIAFQIIPLLVLIGAIWFFPESPRWLTKAGRDDEARYILYRLRGDKEEAETEYTEIKAVLNDETTHKIPTSYVSMITGRGSGDLHIGRRVQLVIWLQIFQEWVGIAGVTIYAPTIFSLAGFDSNKAQWISGLNNIFYMFSTLIAVFTIDRIGRRWTIYWGSVMQGIAMFLCGGFSRLGLDSRSAGDTAAAARYGIAAASMVFLFTFVFGATWLTVPWLYQAEIFALLLPVCFEKIGEKTYYLFGIANVIFIPIMWALYPESNQRTLEEMDLLFAAKTPWVWDAEATFKRLKAERPDIARDARGVSSKGDVERKGSFDHHSVTASSS